MLDRFYAGGKRLVAVSGQLMAYKHGFWRRLDQQVVERKILELLPSLPGVGKVKHATLKGEVVDLLMTLRARDDDPFRWHSDPLRVINCRNGEVWLLDDGNVELRPHRATSYLTHQLQINYDPDAVCPQYDKALSGIFAKSDNPKAMVRHWHELVGYIIQPERKHAIVVIMVGKGNNGKTVLIKTVQRLLGLNLAVRWSRRRPGRRSILPRFSDGQTDIRRRRRACWHQAPGWRAQEDQRRRKNFLPAS